MVTTMVPSDPIKVPKRIPKVIRLRVLTRKVTKKQIRVHINVHTKLPTVIEHQPDIVAAAAPRHAALPSPRLYTSPNWFLHRYCICTPPIGSAIPDNMTYSRLNIFVHLDVSTSLDMTVGDTLVGHKNGPTCGPPYHFTLVGHKNGPICGQPDYYS